MYFFTEMSGHGKASIQLRGVGLEQDSASELKQSICGFRRFFRVSFGIGERPRAIRA
jgi:hypothetical protein